MVIIPWSHPETVVAVNVANPETWLVLVSGQNIRYRIDIRDYDLLPYVSVWNRIGD